MYRVLYRKYRPRFFADVIGQPQVTDTLRNELKADRIAHAYLFTGSRGTGKTTCSKILAKAVNCLNPHDGDPCGKCEVCRGIDDGSIMDVVEIDAASNNGVDDVRLLREEANFTPANTKYRVYIIDEVHMLSIGAFNALLKTLEEPPAHVLFILATTEVHKLPSTIMSRCQRFDFHRIAPQDIADRLKLICEKENITIDDSAALLIAGIADGAMRDALSLLDQCMGHDTHITEEIVRTTAGLADKAHLISLTNTILQHDSASAVNIIGDLYNASKDMSRLCVELMEHFRAIMLAKTLKQPRDMLVMSESDFNQTVEQAQKMDLNFVLSAIDTLQTSFEKMQRGANRRIEMEMTVIKLCTPSGLSSNTTNEVVLPANLENRLNALEEAVRRLLSNPPPQNSYSASNKHTISAPTKRPSAEEMERLRRDAVPMTEWPAVIEDVKKYSRVVGTSFDGSTAYISGKYVLVDSAKDVCFELLRNASQRDKMRDSIRRITGKEYKLGRYSYPEEQQKTDDALSHFMSDLQSADIPVDDIANKK